MVSRKVKIGDVVFGGDSPLAIIAGPCVIEDEKTTLYVAERLREYKDRLKIPIVFKCSYDKANRTSIASYRGPGIEEGLKILGRIKEEFGLPILSDVHSIEEVRIASGMLDAIQIPAFLCRQTDLVLTASKTGKPVNIKKGQFLAPWDVKNIIEKFTSTGNHNLMITERGTTFGYNNLVVDFRAFPIMRSLGYPIVFDVTHSLQLPGGRGSSSGGQADLSYPLTRAAVACGVDGLFMEVHPDPERAMCDGPNMIRLDELGEILITARSIDGLLKRHG